jgi:prolyl 4-hydroxylase
LFKLPYKNLTMQKNWYPQRNTIDAPVALIKNFIHYLKYPVSKFTIEKDAQEQSDYPLNISLATYMKLLEKWGIQHKAFKCGLENLKDIASPSILFMHEVTNTIEGNFVMFYAVKDNEIEYLDARKGWVIEPLEEFGKKFGGVALSAQSITRAESEFEEKEKAYEAKKFANPDLKNVQIKDNFLTDEECEYIIKLSTPEFNKSKLMGEENIVGFGRTSYTAELHVFPNDNILNNIKKRASQLINIPESYFEFFQCVSYDRTQEYANHYDTFDETTENGKRTILEGGQRKYTILAYLNDDFAGGGTHFPNLDLLVEPKKRRVVVFNNLDENEKVIKAAYHAGLPVTTGRKYAMNIWVRNKPFR